MSQTLIMKKELKASIAFSAMTVFDIFRDQLHFAFYLVNAAVAGKVSLDRINDFLKNVRLLYIPFFCPRYSQWFL